MTKVLKNTVLSNSHIIETKKWRRDLSSSEGRVKLIKLEEDWNTAEESMVDELTPIMNKVVGELVKDLTLIIDSKSYIDLINLRIKFHGKLVDLIRKHLYTNFIMGKTMVHNEFKYNKPPVISEFYKQYFIIKAENIVSDLLSRVKVMAVFEVLSGLMNGLDKEQILINVKGVTYNGN